MKFAANLSMLFTEHPFQDRFAHAARCGFKGVEYLFPYEWPADELAGALKDNHLQQALFNLPPGNWNDGERGLASLPGRFAEFSAAVETALNYAESLRPERVHCMAGLRDETITAAQQTDTFIASLRHAAERFAELNVQVLIEPINPFDMPGYFLNDFSQAIDIIDEVNAGTAHEIALQFDIYHCQRIHGDVVRWLEKCAPYTRHLQIAGTPGRHEPATGDLPLDEILYAVKALHPDLWIGCEYRPEGNTEVGLGWMDGWR